MIGKTLSHYKVIEKIGQGGMGEVYRAEDTNLSREVAIKVLPEQFTQDPQRLARFEREAKLLASLNHPNIAAIYGLEEADGVRFLSLELVPGDTLTEEMTRAGVILGTAAYMSPEQAKGEAVDKRADIFAFGCLLYELLTAKRTFDGKTITETLGAIIHKEPEWNALPAATPWRIQELLRRCLTKDIYDRIHDMADARIEIKLALSEPTSVSPTGVVSPEQPPRWKVAIPWSIALLIAVAAGVGFWILTRPVPQPLKKFVITPSSMTLANLGGSDVAISPDGHHIFYRVGGAIPRLQLRSLEDFVDRSIPGTEGVNSVFFSPDGQSAAFFVPGKLLKMSLAGGAATTLFEGQFAFRGGSWDQEDSIVFAAERQGLFRVSAAGGAAEQLAVVDNDRGELAYRSPQILPGGKTVLLTILMSPENFQIGLLSLETGELRIVIENGRTARYSPTGHLVYATAVGGTLMAAPFDLAGLEVTGDPVPVLERVRGIPGASVDYAFSDDGTLVYVPGEETQTIRPGTLVWVDRSGREGEAIVQEPLDYPRYPRISPDGQRLALTTGPSGQGDLWVYDLGGRPPFPLSFEGHNIRAVWTPDGQRVAFTSTRSGAANLFWIPADGSTLEPEPLLTSPTDQVPGAWTPDGRELIFLQTDREQQNNLLALPLEGEREPLFVVETQYPYNPGDAGPRAALSHDGRWLAYVSGVTGSAEIWVRPYPGPGVPIRISPSGGREPVWDPQGQELFYLEGNKMMAVEVALEPGFTSQPPQVLFEGNYSQNSRPSYDVGADGRFLMIKALAEEEGPGQINVVLNWFEELKERVPVP